MFSIYVAGDGEKSETWTGYHSSPIGIKTEYKLISGWGISGTHESSVSEYL